MYSFTDVNKPLYEKWQVLSEKLKTLRQQILKSQPFAFAFDKVCMLFIVHTVHMTVYFLHRELLWRLSVRDGGFCWMR